MKNTALFVLVFALAASLAACGKNVKKDASPDEAARAGEITEISADETVVIVEDESYGVSTISAAAVSLAPVYFALDQYTLSRDARAVLDNNVDAIKAQGLKKLTVEGNCDERGTVSYNISLGDKRAKEIKDYYVRRGIPSADISVVSYGEEKPSCFEKNENCYSQNRRGDTVAN
ncbi:MAG: OmpA family protein [Elusimicrobiota bacterium]|jgi:peptidoglycan-associated lipoprotein|nr:OmpA family protein [Elusimicrobiota bacterium]